MPLELGDVLAKWAKAIDHPWVTYHWADKNLFNPEHQDSIWYDDTVITLVYLNRYELNIKALGDVDIYWKESDDCCTAGTAEERIEWLADHDIKTDGQLRLALMSGKLTYGGGNWFEIQIYDLRAKNWVDTGDDTWDTYPVVAIDSDDMMYMIGKYLKILFKEETEDIRKNNFFSK